MTNKNIAEGFAKRDAKVRPQTQPQPHTVDAAAIDADPSLLDQLGPAGRIAYGLHQRAQKSRDTK